MGEASYVRGASGVGFDGRRALRLGAVVAVVALVAMVVALTVAGADQNRTATRLRDHGVPVEATVSGCVGIGSGIAQAVNYYQCRAAYALGGHTFDAVLGGDRTDLPVGDHLQAVAVPGDPGLLATAVSAAREHTSWTPYLAPLILAAVTVVFVVVLLVRRRRAPAGSANDVSVPGAGRKP